MTKKNVLYISIKESRGPTDYDYGDAPTYENYSRDSISISVDEKAYLKRDSCQDYWTEEVEINFEPKVGQKVFMIVPRYTSGGTFGQTSGYYQIFGVYSTEKAAESMREFLYLENSSSKEGLMGTGMYRAWMGYFESLENIELHYLTVYE
jgi:hypothetical protein